MSALEVNLQGKVAIVTGSNRGIGRGIALRFAEAGSNVVLVDQNTENFENIGSQIKGMGKDVLTFEANITQEEQVVSMVERTVEAFGRIDILVNNAAMVYRVPAEDTTLEQWTHTMAVNLTGTFLCGREVGKMMIRQEKGKIVNMASINSAVVRHNLSAYGASKAGVMHLTRCWAVEWAKHNINVNAVAPSFVETEAMSNVLNDETVKSYLLDRLPIRRFGTVEDVTSAVLYLVSEASNYVTGHTLFVDGGWVAQ